MCLWMGDWRDGGEQSQTFWQVLLSGVAGAECAAGTCVEERDLSGEGPCTVLRMGIGIAFSEIDLVNLSGLPCAHFPCSSSPAISSLAAMSSGSSVISAHLSSILSSPICPT